MQRFATPREALPTGWCYVRELLSSGGEVTVAAVGTSMLPLIMPGDLLRIQRVAPESLSVGDIVVFACEGALIGHRVICCTETSVTTQGDARTMVDASVSKSEILGRVVAVEPRIPLPGKRSVARTALRLARDSLVRPLTTKKPRARVLDSRPEMAVAESVETLKERGICSYWIPDDTQTSQGTSDTLLVPYTRLAASATALRAAGYRLLISGMLQFAMFSGNGQTQLMVASWLAPGDDPQRSWDSLRIDASARLVYSDSNRLYVVAVPSSVNLAKIRRVFQQEEGLFRHPEQALKELGVSWLTRASLTSATMLPLLIQVRVSGSQLPVRSGSAPVDYSSGKPNR